MSTEAFSLSRSWPDIVALVVLGAFLIGIATLGLELYGAWKLCALHAITVPQISGILFGASVDRASLWASPWLSLPAIGLTLILLSVILNYTARFIPFQPAYSGGPRDEMKDAIWNAIAPVRSLALPYPSDAIWHKGDGLYDENLCGLKLYRRGLFRRYMTACLVIRFAGQFYGYPQEVQFAIDFWRRGHETKNLWTGKRGSQATAALPVVVQQLERRVRDLAQTWSAGGSTTYPADWSGQPFASWFPKSLNTVRGVFIGGVAACSSIFVLGSVQAFLAEQYDWAHWGPFGGVTVSSAFALCAFGMVWSTRDAARDGKGIRWRLWLAVTCALIGVGVLLPSIYFLIKSLVLLAPQCARPGA